MNEQEMQFADPDWKPTGPLSAPQENIDASAPIPVPGPVNSRAYGGPPGPQPDNLLAYERGYQGSWPEQESPILPVLPFAQQGQYHPVSVTRGRSRWWIWLIVAFL